MRRHIRQACDSCKRRKAKCDGQPPQCSGCRALGIECQYRLPRAKRGPKPRAAMVPPGDAVDSERSSSQIAGLEGHQGHQKNCSPPVSIRSHGHASASSPSSLPSGVDNPQGATWSSAPPAPRSPHNCPRAIHAHLISTIKSLGLDIEPLVQHYVETWIDQVFQIIPVFSPHSIIQSIPLLLPSAEHRFASAINGSTLEGQEPHNSTLDDMRGFTLITACCAQAMCSAPTGTLAGTGIVFNAFLAASRDMLVFFEDIDVAQPDLYSPLIRIIQSSIMHYQGKNRMSRYLVAQALRLTLDMRLFEEESYEKLDAREAQLRRNLFWTMYTCDKSLSLLNNLPPTLYDHLEDPTRLEMGPDGSPIQLMDGMAQENYQPPYESHLRLAFDISNKQWLLAGDMVRDLDSLHRLDKSHALEQGGMLRLKHQLTQNYLTFCSVLDTIPSWIRDPDSYGMDDVTEDIAQFRRRGYWVQHANLIVTYHCLKLMLAIKAFRLGFVALLGLTDNEELYALRNTDIAGELLNNIERIPFHAMRTNGEAMVEKLRHVGVVLLEIGHRVSNEAIATRAKTLFSRLLDLIASLDSKSSDKLEADAI